MDHHPTGWESREAPGTFHRTEYRWTCSCGAVANAWRKLDNNQRSWLAHLRRRPNRQETAT